MKLIPYVNIRMGTDSHPRFSHGNTLPYTQLPWAMCGFMPQTNGSDGSWFFHSSHRFVEGIRLTHQPSPWINDYGTFLFTPQSDRMYDHPGGGWTGYRPEETTFRPDRLTLRFLRQRCTFDLVPAERGAAIRLHYDLTENRALTVYPLKGENTFRFDAENNILYARTTGHSQDKPVNFAMYMVVRFEKDSIDWEASRTFDAKELGYGCHLMVKKADVSASLAISYLSEEQALYNLNTEVGDDFDALARAAEERWEELLHRIEIRAQNKEQAKTFYSCLYRTFLFPHKAYEYDMESGKAVHYSPFDGMKKNGVRYTDNGFWDTYRTVYPLYALIAKEEYAEILDGFVADYRDGGWLPRWPSLGEVGCMPSTLIDAVIADAAVKGISTPAVLSDALEGMLNHANHEAQEKRYGRNGAEIYCKIGYVPCDREHESVNLTLDAAYGDYCIARVAEVLGHDKDLVANYDRRAKNYKNLFDPKTGFMRAKTEKGEFAEPFEPQSWGKDYTEGCAWQSSFAVPHDIEGLAELYGGREGLIKKLDDLFAEKPDYFVGGYGMEIHEMTEMAAVDFGQCAISNQPSFHFPFMYAMLGEREKASEWVKKLCTAFSSGHDGYPGDEDNGTMSAWYVFACLGIYPVCPGKPGLEGYAFTDMLVKRAKVLGKEWNSSEEGIKSFM
ncbi:MAG: GH92 family glycosyl hydrolase [Clostridia bacterium]|nr:GH92 family glycosyl hydrolase [Clostridia bacterium]